MEKKKIYLLLGICFILMAWYKAMALEASTGRWSAVEGLARSLLGFHGVPIILFVVGMLFLALFVLEIFSGKR